MDKHIASIALATTLFMSSGSHALDTPRTSSIGYPSVEAALKAMRAKTGVQTSVQGGWTIINDRANMALWSFTPPGHPAHPAAVRRAIRQTNGDIFVDLSALCEAEKSACDKLIADFGELSEKMRQELKQRR